MTTNSEVWVIFGYDKNYDKQILDVAVSLPDARNAEAFMKHRDTLM